MSLRTYASGVFLLGPAAMAPAAAQAPAANTAAVDTLAATSGQQWVLNNVRWSYSATPTAGSLTIAWTDPVAGNVSETYYIAAGGPGALMLGNRVFSTGSAVTLTLAAGGSSVSGTVYVDAELQPV